MASPLQRRVIGYYVNAAGLELSTNPVDLAETDVFIVTVPTPIDSAKRSDLTPWHRANPTRRRR